MTERIKVGILGLGRAGWGMHCREIADVADRFEIVAGCDVLDAHRDRFAGQFPEATVYDDVDAFVSDPAIRLVSIASRSADHLEHTRKAVAAGKDVFLEKPMTLTYAEAEAAVRAAEDAGRTIQVRHNRRFEPAFEQVRDIIASGKLGKVFLIKLRRHGFGRRADWQALREHGGGQLLNWGPHLVDHALQFLGELDPAYDAHLNLLTAVGDAEDHVHLHFQGQQGLEVDVEISGGAALPEPQYLIYGTRGALKGGGGGLELKYLDPRVPLADLEADPGTPQDGYDSRETLKWVEETVEVTGENTFHTKIWEALHATLTEDKPFPISNQQALATMKVLSDVREQTPIHRFREG
ncbi:MAG: Gfo/Idh/MocA family protein [Opitutales bacterium]